MLKSAAEPVNARVFYPQGGVEYFMFFHKGCELKFPLPKFHNNSFNN